MDKQQKMITQKLCNYINHTYLLEIKSVQRDKAAAAQEDTFSLLLVS